MALPNNLILKEMKKRENKKKPSFSQKSMFPTISEKIKITHCWIPLYLIHFCSHYL